MQRADYLSTRLPPDKVKTIRHIRHREKRHQETLSFFCDHPDRLLIVHIEKPNWLEKVGEFLSLEVPEIPPQNVKASSTIGPVASEIIRETMVSIGYTREDQQKELLYPGVDPKTIQLFRNNLLSN